jgi:hypothetical protein
MSDALRKHEQTVAPSRSMFSSIAGTSAKSKSVKTQSWVSRSTISQKWYFTRHFGLSELHKKPLLLLGIDVQLL